MRRQARRANGRFTHNTMANTFGLAVYICAACRAMNPVKLSEARPERCHACGDVLVDIADGETAGILNTTDLPRGGQR